MVNTNVAREALFGNGGGMGGRKAITPDAQEVYDSRPSTAPNALPVRPPGHSSRRKPRSRQQALSPTGSSGGGGGGGAALGTQFAPGTLPLLGGGLDASSNDTGALSGSPRLRVPQVYDSSIPHGLQRMADDVKRSERQKETFEGSVEALDAQIAQLQKVRGRIRNRTKQARSELADRHLEAGVALSASATKAPPPGASGRGGGAPSGKPAAALPGQRAEAANVALRLKKELADALELQMTLASQAEAHHKAATAAAKETAKAQAEVAKLESVVATLMSASGAADAAPATRSPRHYPTKDGGDAAREADEPSAALSANEQMRQDRYNFSHNHAEEFVEDFAVAARRARERLAAEAVATASRKLLEEQLETEYKAEEERAAMRAEAQRAMVKWGVGEMYTKTDTVVQVNAPPLSAADDEKGRIHRAATLLQKFTRGVTVGALKVAAGDPAAVKAAKSKGEATQLLKIKRAMTTVVTAGDKSVFDKYEHVGCTVTAAPPPFECNGKRVATTQDAANVLSRFAKRYTSVDSENFPAAAAAAATAQAAAAREAVEAAAAAAAEVAEAASSGVEGAAEAAPPVDDGAGGAGEGPE